MRLSSLFKLLGCKVLRLKIQDFSFLSRTLSLSPPRADKSRAKHPLNLRPVGLPSWHSMICCATGVSSFKHMLFRCSLILIRSGRFVLPTYHFLHGHSMIYSTRAVAQLIKCLINMTANSTVTAREHSIKSGHISEPVPIRCFYKARLDQYVV